MTPFIYLDTSVALAHLLAEDRAPSPALWSSTLVSSRLLEYELWTRIHARSLATSHGDAVRSLTDRVAFLELVPHVLARVLEPFPSVVRTLDAIHLASMLFLMKQGTRVALATYDDRMRDVARALGVPISELC